jgi:hypothetical protein
VKKLRKFVKNHTVNNFCHYRSVLAYNISVKYSESEYASSGIISFFNSFWNIFLFQFQERFSLILFTTTRYSIFCFHLPYRNSSRTDSLYIPLPRMRLFFRQNRLAGKFLSLSRFHIRYIAKFFFFALLEYIL